MSEREREFLRYYNEQRVVDQKEYYLSNSGWHQRRANALIVGAGVIMFLSSIASWASSQQWFAVTAPWNVLATVMPAVSGAIVAIRALYEFDRNHTRFLNTYYDLREAAVKMRPAEQLTGEELRTATVQYITEIENLLSRENRQWVKLMGSADRSGEVERNRQ